MASCHTHADCFFRRVWHPAIPTLIASLGGYGHLAIPTLIAFKGCLGMAGCHTLLNMCYSNSCFRNFAV